MSLITDLKENKGNNTNFVDLLQEIYPDIKTKYYELIIRLIKTECKSVSTGNLSPFQYIMKESLSKYIGTKIDQSIIKRFFEYNEKNMIKENDLSHYKNFSEVKTQVIYADEIEDQKKLENEIIKLFENDEWLIIKPLSYRSSVKYGYNTKWCTAMNDKAYYFDTYSSNGILIYCINKKTNVKVALHKKIVGGTETTFWNQQDFKIDSLDANLPNEVMAVLRDDINSNKLKTNKQQKEDKGVKDNNIITEKIKSSFNGSSTNDELYNRALELMRRLENN